MPDTSLSHRSLATLAFVIGLSTSFAPTLAWGTDDAPSLDGTKALIQDTCRAALREPIPTPRETPAKCDALDLYDGIGRKPDYRAARSCALRDHAD